MAGLVLRRWAPGATRCARRGLLRATRPATTAAAAAAETPAAAAAAAEALPPLRLHNTLGRAKEEFHPRVPGEVSMYVCGVTVYDYSHIGHARVYVAFDTLYRVLMSRGLEVTYTRNFTDIDDKIINRANEVGESCQDLTDRFIDAFHEDMAALRCLPPTNEPRATQHVDDIIALIERIIANGHAYAADGDVYFAVDTLPEYGALSGRQQEDNRAGERVAVDQRKRNPADFALWKSAKPGEPTWDSPWGPGRPGWHIECSAMVEKVCGPVIDIHGGGMDLTFPHHENELAQSTAACVCCEGGAKGGQLIKGGERGFARYWVHNGFVRVDSEKMSKSLGNFFTIREVLERYPPMALRWMLLGTHYRAAINYTQRALEEAADRVYYVYTALLESGEVLAGAEEDGKAPAGVAAEAVDAARKAKAQILEAVSDDLNTPLALGALSAPLKAINDLTGTKKGRKAAGRIAALRELRECVESTLALLGMGTEDPAAELEALRVAALGRAGLTPEKLEARIAERAEARAAKDFARSDALRDELAGLGVMLMDGGGAAWRPGVPPHLVAHDAATDAE